MKSNQNLTKKLFDSKLNFSFKILNYKNWFIEIDLKETLSDKVKTERVKQVTKYTEKSTKQSQVITVCKRTEDIAMKVSNKICLNYWNIRFCNFRIKWGEKKEVLKYYNIIIIYIIISREWTKISRNMGLN